MITYPIQDTDRFTVYDTEAGTPLKDGSGRPMTRKRWGSEDKTQMLKGLADSIKWLIEVSEDKPTDYDPLTHKVQKAPVNYDVENEQAVSGWEIVALPEADVIKADRAAKRDAMKASWVGLPAWIRGYFHPQFRAANELLDGGDSEAALAIVEGVDPNTTISGDPEKLATFEAVKAQFIASINELPDIPEPPQDIDII